MPCCFRLLLATSALEGESLVQVHCRGKVWYMCTAGRKSGTQMYCRKNVGYPSALQGGSLVPKTPRHTAGFAVIPNRHENRLIG